MQLFARRLAFQFALEARNEIAIAVQIGQRFGRTGLVQHLAAVVTQRVDEGDDSVVRNLHGTPRV